MDAAYLSSIDREDQQELFCEGDATCFPIFAYNLVKKDSFFCEVSMFNPRSNGPYARNNGIFGSSRYQYQTLPYGYEGAQSSSGLISKVMGLLAFSFLFACIGTFVGFYVLQTIASFRIVAIGGLVVLIALNFAIQKPGLNLFLLYLFTFLEGMAISPIIGYYLAAQSNILGEAFLITAITSFALAAYAWTTKRNFTRLGDYLFFGVILLLIASVWGCFSGEYSTLHFLS